MKKELERNFIVTGIIFLFFIIFTILVKVVDVQAIGPESSKIGFASLNGWMHDSIGEHVFWYDVTKYLGVLSLLVAAMFGGIGLMQLIKGRSLYKVDVAIVLMGVFYVLVGIFYVLFEVVVVNYRPMILDAKDGLEASYPSSHTMLVVCIMAAAMIYCRKRVRDPRIGVTAMAAAGTVIVITVIGRLVCGVHWFTDIIGGLLLGAALVMLYYSVLEFALSLKKRKKRRR